MANLSAAEAKRTKANLAYWLKSQGIHDAKNVRGDQRQKWLAEFVVMKAKEKGVPITQHTTQVVAAQTVNNDSIHWMTYHKMSQELGDAKALPYKGSGMIKTRPCQVTGSIEPDLLEYGVPICIESTVNTTENKTELKSEEAVKDVDAALETFASASLARGSANVAVKKEPEDPAELEKQRVAKMIHDKAFLLQKVQTMSLEAEVTKEQAVNNKYAATVHEELTKIIPRLKKVEKGLRQMCLSDGEPAYDGALRLSNDLPTVEKDFEELTEWSARLGLKGAGSSQSGGEKRPRK